MKKHKTLILTTLVCLLPMLYAAAVYQRLPEPMAVHWGADGQPNGYASRLTGAVLLPLLLAAINLVTHVALNHDPKKENASGILLAIGQWCIPVLSNLAMALMILWNLSYQVPISQIVMLAVGLLIVIIGNYLPKTRQSYTVGIKLPWTLDSEENWRRTHHLAGYLWVLSGIVIMAAGVLALEMAVLVVVPVLVLIPCVYSFILYKKGI